MDGRRVTVHSDGFGGPGTVVVDQDGNKVENVTAITMEVQAGEPTEIHLAIVGAGLKIDGNLKTCSFECPGCGDMTDHECDQVVGGTPATGIKPAIPVNPPANGNVMLSRGELRLICQPSADLKTGDFNNGEPIYNHKGEFIGVVRQWDMTISTL